MPGRPVFFEQLHIELKDGKLTYIPLVGKQGPSPFDTANPRTQAFH